MKAKGLYLTIGYYFLSKSLSTQIGQSGYTQAVNWLFGLAHLITFHVLSVVTQDRYKRKESPPCLDSLLMTRQT